MRNSRKQWWLVLSVTALLLGGCAGKEAAEESEFHAESLETAEEKKESGLLAEGTEYEKGTFSEDGWESRWLSLRFMAPSGAVMVSEEELKEMMGLGGELLSEDYENWQVEEGELATVWEMMCKAEDQVTYAMVTVEKLSEAVGLEAYAAEYESALTGVSAIDYEIVSNDEVVFIGGAEYRKLACTTNYYNVQIYQDYYIRMVEDLAVSIVITYMDEAAAEELLACFSAY